MEPVIRPGRPEDHAAIAAWTQNTFTWGDYVADRWDDWMADPDCEVAVADVDGRPVALSRVAMVSSTEAWSNAARVHPDHRRQGLATAVASRLWPWAAERGARVVRLAVEDWNEAAHGQVIAMGFHRTSSWFHGSRGVGENSPVPTGNGGRRVAGAEGLRPAHGAEAEPALLSWDGGELCRAAGGLFPTGWTWRQLRLEHLVEAARDRALWEGRPGWAVASVDDEAMRVQWLETSEEDAAALVRALVDRAADIGVERLQMMIPAVPWLRRALGRADFELTGLGVYTLPL